MKEERQMQKPYRNMVLFFVGLIVVLFVIAAAAPAFLIGNGKLTTSLNGNGQSMTNVGTISVTNLTVMGGSVSGVVSSVTNGDSSISTVSTSGVHYVRATNITEAKQLLTDVTTANASASAHGYLPELTTATNGVPINSGSAAAWGVISNLMAAGTNVTLRTTNGITTIHASGGSSGGGLTGNLVWVDAVNGNDGTGARGDMAHPFALPSAANTAATSGDLVVVLPGLYNDFIDLKNGVNWHFFNGAIVTNAANIVVSDYNNGPGITNTKIGRAHV